MLSLGWPSQALHPGVPDQRDGHCPLSSSPIPPVLFYISHPTSFNFLPIPLFPTYFPPLGQLRQKAAWCVEKSNSGNRGHAWCLGAPSSGRMFQRGVRGRWVALLTGSPWSRSGVSLSLSLPASFSSLLLSFLFFPTSLSSFLPAFLKQGRRPWSRSPYTFPKHSSPWTSSLKSLWGLLYVKKMPAFCSCVSRINSFSYMINIILSFCF